MNDQRNPDRPASTLTKREHAALMVFTTLMRKHDDYALMDLAGVSVAYAEMLFYELDTPHELRDDFDHEGTP